ncbi:MAG TPA: hypothetical protein DCM87_17805, partial [Planctomycetes bacterium]|nr:hypothetical protein [Planctomycetota bacterium]
GALDIADAVWILSYLFRHGRAPTCLETANANGDGRIDIADAIRILGYLFSQQEALPAPFESCGTDPRAAGERCVTYEPCEGR